MDVRKALGQNISHISPESFQQYLLQDQEGPMFDLLKKERVFSVKTEHLTQFTNPSSPPADADQYVW